MEDQLRQIWERILQLEQSIGLERASQTKAARTEKRATQEQEDGEGQQNKVKKENNMSRKLNRASTVAHEVNATQFYNKIIAIRQHRTLQKQIAELQTP